ncbi:MAG: hypothetical protein D6808_02290 [Candidatus Dadabacteria bacterium]|nr:MAG: hypothetical protein D6808_02290 [Candidatus Dadabacteria bacterium]
MFVGLMRFSFISLLLYISSVISARPLFADFPSTFAFGLGLELTSEEISKLQQYDLVVVDGTDTSSEQVAQIKANGAIVLGYASAGTIEEGRWWSEKLKEKFSIGYWEEWGEWYAAVSKRKYRIFFLRKIAKPILKKGFDGLFLDNVDMISQFPRQTRGMKRLLKMVRKKLGSQRLLFVQNGDNIIGKFEKYIDGWNREDVTSTYNFDSKTYQLQPEKDRNSALAKIIEMISKGFIITTADYTADGDLADTALSVANACAVGAIPFVSDIHLSRLPDEPFRCQ